jgi:hypothetical protein
VLGLPLRVGHERERPQVGLHGQLVVELVEDQRQVLAARQLAVHPDLAESAGQGWRGHAGSS